MKNLHISFRILGVGLAALTLTSLAHAQATRTWVSGLGDDVNPCSRTAPCKTFAGAISKTAIQGEINCLDPGGFGAVTITKAMTPIHAAAPRRARRSPARFRRLPREAKSTYSILAASAP